MAKIHYDLDDMVQQALCILSDNNMEVEGEKPIDYGYQIRLYTGSIICIYVTGKILVQGVEDKALEIILKGIKKHY